MERLLRHAMAPHIWANTAIVITITVNKLDDTCALFRCPLFSITFTIALVTILDTRKMAMRTAISTNQLRSLVLMYRLLNVITNSRVL